MLYILNIALQFLERFTQKVWKFLQQNEFLTQFNWKVNTRHEHFTWMWFVMFVTFCKSRVRQHSSPIQFCVTLDYGCSYYFKQKPFRFLVEIFLYGLSWIYPLGCFHFKCLCMPWQCWLLVKRYIIFLLVLSQ